MMRLHVAPGHFEPSAEDEARCLREYGFDRRHLYALMAAVAAWRAALLPVTREQVTEAVQRERGLSWAGKCLDWLTRHRYVQVVGWTGNGNVKQYAPTQLGLSKCPAPPAEGVAAE